MRTGITGSSQVTERAAQTCRIVRESVVDFWECIPRDWPAYKYDIRLADDVDCLFRGQEARAGSIRRVLDCGCGTGNPSIGLAKRGYDVWSVDANPHMVKRFRSNCRSEKVQIPVLGCDWRRLCPELFSCAPFDAVICRGNSLIYAGSWDGSFVGPDAARGAIEESLRSIASVIRPQGLFYVDLTSAKEYADSNARHRLVGVRETDSHSIRISWRVEYNPARRLRRVHGRREFVCKPDGNVSRVTSYTFSGYMLSHDELECLASQAGLCRHIADNIMPSEWLYDPFLFGRSE